MGGEAILVVDDAEVNRTLTDIVLTDEGFDVHTAAGGGEALSLLRSFHPDLMLVDIRMPGMDGLELTRRVKQNERTRDVVVVALSACAEEGYEQKAAATSCDGYITKPIDTHMLGTQVRKYGSIAESMGRIGGSSGKFAGESVGVNRSAPDGTSPLRKAKTKSF